MLNNLILSVNTVFYNVIGKLPFMGHVINAPQNVKAFLLVIRRCEGTSKSTGYRTLFGGSLFSNMSNHPINTGEWKGGVYAGQRATAAGAYQMILATWNTLQKRLNLKDFSPASQDKAAIQLLKDCNAYSFLEMGKIEDALRVASPIWASLPYSTSGQPKKSVTQAVEWYKQNGGSQT